MISLGIYKLNIFPSNKNKYFRCMYIFSFKNFFVHVKLIFEFHVFPMWQHPLDRVWSIANMTNTVHNLSLLTGHLETSGDKLALLVFVK